MRHLPTAHSSHTHCALPTPPEIVVIAADMTATIQAAESASYRKPTYLGDKDFVVQPHSCMGIWEMPSVGWACCQVILGFC